MKTPGSGNTGPALQRRALCGGASTGPTVRLGVSLALTSPAWSQGSGASPREGARGLFFHSPSLHASFSGAPVYSVLFAAPVKTVNQRLALLREAYLWAPQRSSSGTRVGHLPTDKYHSAQAHALPRTQAASLVTKAGPHRALAYLAPMAYTWRQCGPLCGGH